MKRGEIWEANVGGKAGRRPVLILTRSPVIPYLSKVVVAEITTQGKGYPTQIAIGQNSNLRKDSFVSADSLHTLPKDRLVKYLGDLPMSLQNEINKAVIFALNLAG
ncbi:MAG: type II toxin-antitoxin system PemK/MazF family toxin [Deltaproteobacteria bacterium]|nr:type II toxin-antitoxin system PemK/MazF family toxin [Deltaproteobacteria bacterium]